MTNINILQMDFANMFLAPSLVKSATRFKVMQVDAGKGHCWEYLPLAFANSVQKVFYFNFDSFVAK